MLSAVSLSLLLAAAVLDPAHTAHEDFAWNLPSGFPPPKVPARNPMSKEKVKLGRYLFYDKRLSANGEIACATCHRQELAFTDGRALPLGVTGQPHSRSAPSLVNVAYNSVLTWSNPKLTTLEAQALIPLQSNHPVEMGLPANALIRLQTDPVYHELFPKAFPHVSQPFTLANLASALAAFERTIISSHSPYDRFIFEGDIGAISESAKRGELLFFTDKATGCFRCHSGFNFSDATEAPRFHNTGLYNLPGPFSYPETNPGLYEHTRKPADVGKFKTPTLRNIALTAPYMHDGSIPTLDAVLDHYQRGGRTTHIGSLVSDGSANPLKDPLMTGFTLTDQNRRDLIAFLQSLTDTTLIHDPRFSNPWPPDSLQ